MFREEVQSGYFDQRQVSIHPMMAYYLEDVSTEQESGGINTLLVKHAIIGISPDVRHDNILVKSFEDQALDLLNNQPGMKLEKLIEWTDGCSAQYKCKFSFVDICQRSSQVAIERTLKHLMAKACVMA